MYGEEGDEKLEPQNPKNYKPTGEDLSELSAMGIQGAKQSRDASYIASKMGKMVDYDGGYEAMSGKAKKARSEGEAKLDKLRGKQAVSLDIDSIWDEITEDMGPAPVVPTPGGDEKKPPASGDSRPRKSDVADLPEDMRSDEPEDAKALSEGEAEGEEDMVKSVKESAWRVSDKFADFVGEVYDEQPEPTDWQAVKEELLSDGSAEECPSCGAVSAYAWDDANYCENCTEPMGLELPEEDRIYHIGAASGFEWECGKCRKSWTPEDSPLTAEVYTHVDPSQRRESSAKTADTADNGYEIDGAAAPSGKETGKSPIVDCHEGYDAQQSKGAAVAPATRALNIAELQAIPAGRSAQFGEYEIERQKPSFYVVKKDGQQVLAGTAQQVLSLVPRAKQADTADNPANWHGGEGVVQPKTDADIKDTTGPDAKCAWPGPSPLTRSVQDMAKAKSETE